MVLDVENYRALLTALIAALPTVMSLGIIALIAFLTTKIGIKKTKYYWGFACFLMIVIGLFIASIFINIGSLATLSAEGSNDLLLLGIDLSFASLFVMVIYLYAYVIAIPYIWK